MKEKIILEVKNLYKTYPGREKIEALKGVSFTLKKGESLSIFGPSGAGKTTLLWLIGGLDEPTRGHILLEGLNLGTLSPGEKAKVRREKIGFIFQFFYLLPHLSVLENLMLPLLLKGKDPPKRAREKVEDFLKRVNLGERKDFFPSFLSGGEQQKVAVARALIKSPLLVLADEPIGSLPWEMGKKVLSLLFDWVKEGGSLIICTNNEEVAKATSRSLYLKEGRLVHLPNGKILV